MKIGLISTAAPLINGGGRFIVDWLQEKLIERGHQVETVYIPSTEERDYVLPQMTAIKMMKLDNYFDRVITFRPPAHVIQHPRKIVWFIHHIRVFYDLWHTPYRPFPDDAAHRALRAAIMAADTAALSQAYRIFTNSRVVSERVRNFNGIESEVLYPPVLKPELFNVGPYGDEIVSVCRMEHHKRQHLLVEAMALTRTPVRLCLRGASSNDAYAAELNDTVSRLGLSERVSVQNAWISEDEKSKHLEGALASAYIPFDEDSYGYPTIEAAHAERCTITMEDSGGVAEFVINGKNGLVVAPTAAALAEAFDRLYLDKAAAQRMGRNAMSRVTELGIDWDTVISKLLA